MLICLKLMCFFRRLGLYQGRFLTTIEGWAGRYPGWALGGGGGRLDIYTVDIAILIILTIVCYMYTGEKKKKKKKTFMGSLEYHALFFLY